MIEGGFHFLTGHQQSVAFVAVQGVDFDEVAELVCGTHATGARYETNWRWVL